MDSSIDQKINNLKLLNGYLTNEETTQLNEIVKRWDDTIPIVLCEDCISDALRHKRRNMDRYCEDKKNNDIHCTEDDPWPEAFSHSPKDIQTLLDIIYRLTG